MLKRPSSRRKSNDQPLSLNLVPLLDALVTIIAFLLITMSFMHMVSISSPVPIVSDEDNRRLLNKKPLQLTMEVEPDYIRIKALFNQVPPKRFDSSPDGTPDLISIHDHLIGIKQKFPGEKQIVITPHPSISYDLLIAVMDSVQQLEKTDPPIFWSTPDGLDQEIKELFSEVVFGNLLGG